MPKVEVISRRRVFDDFFKIDEADLRFERYDGTMSEAVRRLNFERGDSAAALLSDAARVAEGGGVAAEHEDIRLVPVALDDFLARLAAHGFADAKTIVAGYWLKDNLTRLL